MTSDELDAAVAEAVRVWRARHRVQQTELADKLGWSRPSLSALENGSRGVSLFDAFSLCAAMGIPLGELLRDAPAEARATFGLD